ncbi:site-specific integrase, partial [Anaerorhabdus sp.]|uniref:site-specific integrase n=1 Tax=Anaerorhabdus sp. TaxID=1872524 RepID=UPI002FC5A2BC
IGEDRYITINKSMKHGEDTLHVPKTQGSRRKIKIDEQTYQTLEILLKRPGKWLFGDYEPIGISTIQRAFTDAIKTSKVKKIRIHDLRHSHATILINNGVNIVAVSKRLGHSDINMTLKVYTHLLEKTEDNLMEVIESLRNGANLVPNDKENTKKAD